MPQSNAAKRTPPKKGSGKPKAGGGKDKAALELNEYNEAKQINKDIIACAERLSLVLRQGGVPESSLKDLNTCTVEKIAETAIEVDKKQIDDVINALTQAERAADEAWSFSLYFPVLNTDALLNVLTEFRTLLCNRATLARTSVQRKLADVRSDPKAESALLDTWTKAEKQVNDVVTKCRMGASKVRVLMAVAKEGQNAVSKPTEEISVTQIAD